MDLKRFLQSKYYIILIYTVTFLAWTQIAEVEGYMFNPLNMAGIFFILIAMAMVLATVENTVYVIANVMGLLFILNKKDMTFDTLSHFGLHSVVLMILFSAMIIHFIRFKPKFKMGHFFFGLLLIAFAYVMPLFKLPVSTSLLTVSLVGFMYVVIYAFFTSTVKTNTAFMFQLMLLTNLLLVAQVFFYIYQGFLLSPDVSIYERILTGWNRNLGWANINDMCFYISFTFPAYVYYIIKKPKQIGYWFLSIFPVMAILLSKSRGGIIGFLVVLALLFAYLLKHKNKNIIRNGLITLGVVIVLSVLAKDLYVLWYQDFISSWNGNLDQFSSGRLTIYRAGLDVFRENILFGGGWNAAILLFENRIFMWHSTIIQTLAAMGLFGAFALAVHFKEVWSYLYKDKTVHLIFIGYIASQVHGLIDNVQYAVPYSMMLVALLAMIERRDDQKEIEEGSNN